MIEAGHINHSLDRFFKELRSALGNDLDDVLEELELSRAALSSRISLKTVNLVANRFNVTMDSIFEGTVDFETLKNQFQGSAVIPKKYTGIEYSSRFSSIYMVNCCKKLMGPQGTRLLLQRFQLKEDHFENMSDRNNILLPSDLCAYVNQYYGSDKVEEMGESSLELMSQTEVGKNMKELVKGREYFDYYFNELLPGNVEKNYSWKIHKQGPGFIEVQGLPNPEVVEALGRDRVITPHLETLRMGFLKSIPKLYQDVSTKVLKMKSMSNGDSFDLLRLDYASNPTSPRTLH